MPLNCVAQKVNDTTDRRCYDRLPAAIASMSESGVPSFSDVKATISMSPTNRAQSDRFPRTCDFILSTKFANPSLELRAERWPSPTIAKWSFAPRRDYHRMPWPH